MESVKCMVYGRPNSIPAQKASLYFTYAPSFMKDPVAQISDGALKYEVKDEGSAEELQKNME
jgi:hypothetical protein